MHSNTVFNMMPDSIIRLLGVARCLVSKAIILSSITSQTSRFDRFNCKRSEIREACSREGYTRNTVLLLKCCRNRKDFSCIRTIDRRSTIYFCATDTSKSTSCEKNPVGAFPAKRKIVAKVSAILLKLLFIVII